MKKPFIKKFLALALAASMVVSVPLLSVAEGISDAYDEVTEVPRNNSSSSSTNTGTETISGTSTDTGIFTKLKDDKNRILGINFDKTSVEVQVTESVIVQANLAFENTADTITLGVTEVNREDSNGFIKYTVYEKNALYDVDPEKPQSPIKIYRMKNDAGKYTGQLRITGVVPGTATIKASIDADQDGVDDFEDYCYVTVDASTSLEITPVNLFKGHTYDLNDCTKVVYHGKDKDGNDNDYPVSVKDAGEKVTYSASADSVSSKDMAKCITISDNGVLTLKKIPTVKNGAGEAVNIDKVNITAVRESDGLQKTVPFSIGEEHPATEVQVITLTPKTNQDPKNMNPEAADFSNPLKATLKLDPGAGDKDYIYEVEVQAKYKDNNELKNSTDSIVFTSNDKKEAVISIKDVKNYDGTGKATAVIEANGVGKATVTATSTSKKKATITVTVTATLTGLKVNVADTIYTGQKVTAGYTIETGRKNITTKDKVNFKLVYTDKYENDGDEVAYNKKNASVSNKGVITVKNMFSELNTEGKRSDDVTLIGTVVNHNNITGEKNIKIKQSDIKGITIQNPDGFVKGTNESGLEKGTVTDDYELAVRSNPYKYTVSALDEKGNPLKELVNSVDMSISGKQASLEVADGGIANIKAISAGKPSLKLSFITLTQNPKTSKYSAKKNTVTVKLNVTQHTTQLVLKKAEQVVSVDKLTKPQTVTVAVSQQLPKGTKDTIKWQVKAGYLTKDEEGNDSMVIDNDVKLIGAKEIDGVLIATGKSVKVSIPENTPVGTVIKVSASTDNGTVAYGYIYVTKPTVGVQLGGGSKEIKIGVGEARSLEPKIKTDKSNTAQFEDLDFVATLGTSMSYTTEPVTYTVDKKGASIVKVNSDGTVIGLQPGTATITAKTISGKSAKIKITVK
jgi:hypothetical protein